MPWPWGEPGDAKNTLPASGTETPEHEADGAAYLRALKRAGNVEPPGTPAPGTPASPAPAARERRRHPRYKCEGGLQFRTAEATVLTRVTFSDLSLSGCYVEIMSTCPPGTSLQMTLELRGLRVQCEAAVRTSYPFLGMGIEFTRMTEASRQHLEEMVRSLAQDSAPVPPDATPAGSGDPQPSFPKQATPPSAEAVLATLQAFFATEPVLTREAFTKMLEPPEKP
jgi:hypothetical protein